MLAAMSSLIERLWGHRAPRLNLALQGGGAHGAFTWGVLDALLEQAPFQLGAVSGASAGAMNAAVLAHGLLAAGNDGARAALSAFWLGVASRVPLDGWIVEKHDDPGGPAMAPGLRALVQWTQLFAPTQFNPLDINPLREILREQVDFERLRSSAALPLHIAATHANSGRLRVFSNEDLSIDALLASACIPHLHHPVVIDGEPYWDGAYAANPVLSPLVFDPLAGDDTLLVLLMPNAWARTPKSADEIRARVAEVAFQSTFLREARWLSEAQRMACESPRWRRGRLERALVRQRWHTIDGGETLAPLRGETRSIATTAFLEQLRDAGRAQALRWLQAHAADVGQRSSADLFALYAAAPPTPPAPTLSPLAA